MVNFSTPKGIDSQNALVSPNKQGSPQQVKKWFNTDGKWLCAQ